MTIQFDGFANHNTSMPDVSTIMLGHHVLSPISASTLIEADINLASRCLHEVDLSKAVPVSWKTITNPVNLIGISSLISSSDLASRELVLSVVSQGATWTIEGQSLIRSRWWNVAAVWYAEFNWLSFIGVNVERLASSWDLVVGQEVCGVGFSEKIWLGVDLVGNLA